MRALIQRVSRASVTSNDKDFSSIGKGLLIFLGIEVSDSPEDVNKLISKLVKLRIFNDENGNMNLSISDIDGEFLVVSQFTLHADVRKGNRPSFIKSARPEVAIPLYESFIETLAKVSGKEIKTGIFGAAMKVELVNDGPVTILVDTKE